ncbi:MAG: hypothetical protein ACE5NM_12720, partial [Sedimentisphaerales bacterium]
MCRKLIYLVSFVLALMVTASSTNADITTGLVGHWMFDEGSGTTAADLSGNGNHGNLQGDPRWVVGHIRGALHFDGVDDWVEVPHHESLTVDNEVTVAAWINAERHAGPGGASWQGIIAKSNNPRSYSFYTRAAGDLHFSTGPGG